MFDKGRIMEQSLKEQISKIKEEFLKDRSLKEGGNYGIAIKAIDSNIKDLIFKIQNGLGIDERSYDNLKEGELLSQFLKPILQSTSMLLKDRKGFFEDMKEMF